MQVDPSEENANVNNSGWFSELFKVTMTLEYSLSYGYDKCFEKH